MNKDNASVVSRGGWSGWNWLPPASSFALVILGCTALPIAGCGGYPAQDVLEQETPGSIAARLAEIEEKLAHPPINEAAWMRAAWAGRAIGDLNARIDDSPRLQRAQLEAEFGEDVAENWRLILAGPELERALERLEAAHVPDHSLVDLEVRLNELLDLLRVMPIAATLASLDGDSAVTVRRYQLCLSVVELAAQGPDHGGWVLAALALDKLISMRGQWGEPVDQDAAAPEREDDVDVIATADALKVGLTAAGLERISASLESALRALPTREQVLLLDERFDLEWTLRLLSEKRALGKAHFRELRGLKMLRDAFLNAPGVENADAFDDFCAQLRRRLGRVELANVGPGEAAAWLYVDLGDITMLESHFRRLHSTRRRAEAFLQRLRE